MSIYNWIKRAAVIIGLSLTCVPTGAHAWSPVGPEERRAEGQITSTRTTCIWTALAGNSNGFSNADMTTEVSQTGARATFGGLGLSLIHI